MTTLLERVTSAAQAGHPRELLTLRTSSDLTALAANASTGMNGGKLIKGVPLCKVGSFNGGDAMGGIDLDAATLAAIAQRFAVLSPKVLVPPIRLDHGWSVRDVIGKIAGLGIADLPDESDGGATKTFLIGDLHIVDDQALRLISLGLLNNRSLELNPYRTNAGVIHPLVCFGLAFVDIPAVEGLGGIKLGAPRPDEARIIVLTETTRGETVSPAAPAAPPAEAPTAGPELSTNPQVPGPDVTPPTPEQVPAPQDAPDAPVADPAAPATPREEPVPDGTAVHDEAEVEAASGLPDDAPLDDPAASAPAALPAPVVTEPTGGQGEPTEAQLAAARTLLGIGSPTAALANLTPARLSPAAALRQAGFTEQAEQLERDHAAAVQLRVDTYARAGRIPPRDTTALAAARTLLGHSDPAIVTAAGQLLDAVAAPVVLGERLGRQSSEAGPGGADERTPAALAALPPEEFPAAWQALSSDQRGKPEFDRVYQDWRKTQS